MTTAHTRSRRRILAGAAAAFLSTLVGAPAVHAATSTIQVDVLGGGLTLGTSNFTGLSATLTGSDQTVSSAASAPWQVTDARGTGAAWSVVATATNLVSAGTPNRVIASSGMAITTGTVTALPGADAATGFTTATAAPFTVPTGPGATQVTLLSTAGPHRGGYTFTPALDVTIPGNALPAWPGVPYAATLTVTIS